jgi:uncharacterized DUF497 family protein
VGEEVKCFLKNRWLQCLIVRTIQNMVTYDETKRRLNIRNHGIDFAACEAIFDGPMMSLEDRRDAYGEQRINALGFLESGVVHVTYTERGDDLRFISVRKAEKHEIRLFAKFLAR